MIKACIFDLDGTLTDTVESIARGVNRTLESFGYDPRPVEEYNFYAGDGIDMALKTGAGSGGRYGGETSAGGDPALPEMVRGGSPLPCKTLSPYLPGDPAAGELGVKRAVFSNKPHPAAVQVVEAVFGQGYFDLIQGQTAEIPGSRIPQGSSGSWRSCRYSRRNACISEIPIRTWKRDTGPAFIPWGSPGGSGPGANWRRTMRTASSTRPRRSWRSLRRKTYEEQNPPHCQ